MNSKEKVLMILGQGEAAAEQMKHEEIRNMIMRTPCKRDSEKVIVELYLLSVSLEEVVKEVEAMQGEIETKQKIKGMYEGVNMIAGLRRDTAMIKDGLARVKEKIERG